MQPCFYNCDLFFVRQIRLPTLYKLFAVLHDISLRYTRLHQFYTQFGHVFCALCFIYSKRKGAKKDSDKVATRILPATVLIWIFLCAHFLCIQAMLQGFSFPLKTSFNTLTQFPITRQYLLFENPVHER